MLIWITLTIIEFLFNTTLKGEGLYMVQALSFMELFIELNFIVIMIYLKIIKED